MRERLLSICLVVILLLLSLLPGSAYADAPPADTPTELNDRFGLVHVSYGAGATAPGRYQKAVNSGARWNRWVAYWYDIETEPGVYDFSRYDATIDADLSYGLKLDVVLMGAPKFLRWQNQGKETTAPLGLYVPVFEDGTDVLEPGKLPNPWNPWATFVYTMAAHYQGKVNTWEVWNEPDFDFFWNTGDGREVEHYVRLLKVAYLAVKAADPTANVAVGGMMYWQWTLKRKEMNGWLKAFLQELAKDPQRQANHFFFDVLPWHWYAMPEDLYDVVVNGRMMLEQQGIRGKQLWLNEANLPVCPDPILAGKPSCEKLPFFGTPDEQSAYLWQLFALGFAAGLDRIFVFQLYDDGAGERGERFGLVRLDESQREAYGTFQMAARHFRDIRSISRGTDAAANMVTLVTKDKRLIVVWNTTRYNYVANVWVQGKNPRVVKEDGSSSPLKPLQNGLARFVLPARPRGTVGWLGIAPPSNSSYLVVEDLPAR